ncbi:non-contractile tail tubular protein [Enterobacter phage 03_vB_Eclo_IJM]|nr:non-contractile tail tubular protein [Enterobacter phage 03_vB_Eclo_IJM]
MTKGPTCLRAAGRSKSGEHPGDWSNKTVFIGRSYNMRYKFSRFLIKSENDTGVQTEDTGRRQLRRAWVNYQDTGAQRLTVSERSARVRQHPERYTLGQQALGTSNIGDGQFRFAMNGNAMTTSLVLDRLSNPVSIVGGGWEASYAKKAQRV